jgi:hypothetical protein
MANPYKDRDKRKKVAPGGGQTDDSVVVDTVIDNVLDDVSDNMLENVTETPAPVSVGEMLTGKIEKKPEGKSVSLYLTTEALENLEKFAKINKCSKSKAADLILRSLY